MSRSIVIGAGSLAGMAAELLAHRNDSGHILLIDDTSASGAFRTVADLSNRRPPLPVIEISNYANTSYPLTVQRERPSGPFYRSLPKFNRRKR